MCAKKVVRYKRINGVLVKQYESPALIDGLVDISQLPIVGDMGSAVIESGENANGRYTKFADGTMICTSTVKKSNQNIAPDDIFWGYSNYVFPANFVADGTKTITVCAFATSADNYNVQIGYILSHGTPTIFNTGAKSSDINAANSLKIGGNAVITDFTINITAIGLWK